MTATSGCFNEVKGDVALATYSEDILHMPANKTRYVQRQLVRSRKGPTHEEILRRW